MSSTVEVIFTSVDLEQGQPLGEDNGKGQSDRSKWVAQAKNTTNQITLMQWIKIIFFNRINLYFNQTNGIYADHTTPQMQNQVNITSETTAEIQVQGYSIHAKVGK